MIRSIICKYSSTTPLLRLKILLERHYFCGVQNLKRDLFFWVRLTPAVIEVSKFPNAFFNKKKLDFALYLKDLIALNVLISIIMSSFPMKKVLHTKSRP